MKQKIQNNKKGKTQSTKNKNKNMAIQEIDLNEENALKVLHLLLEKAQKGKAFPHVKDAALIHRGLMYLMKKPQFINPEYNKNPELTPTSALEVVGQGIHLGQTNGVFTLEEATHAVTILTLLASIVNSNTPSASGNSNKEEENDGGNEDAEDQTKEDDPDTIVVAKIEKGKKKQAK